MNFKPTVRECGQHFECHPYMTSIAIRAAPQKASRGRCANPTSVKVDPASSNSTAL
jgi:hypothetical protein